MADASGLASAPRRPWLWTEIFRCFQVALDPRKLAVAAAGILAMSLGWYLLSVVFWRDRPNKDFAEYVAVVAQEPESRTRTPEEIRAEANRRYERDLADYVSVVSREFEGKNKTPEEIRAEAVNRYNR